MGQKLNKKVRRIGREAAKASAWNNHEEIITKYMDMVCRDFNRKARRKFCRQVRRQINPFTGKSLRGNK